jgi:RNA polymerase sigma-70 factor (ECF subfamily)
VREISDPDAFRTWLYTTVRNACLMKRRRRAGEPTHFVPVEKQAVALDPKMADPWIDRRLRAALATLPRPSRAIVVLREIEGLSTREVATVMGISEDNVKTRLHRARVLLRRALEETS